MIKPTLLVRLLKERLAHNEAYLKQPLKMLESLGLKPDKLDKSPGYRKAIEEEIQFLRAVLEDAP